MSSPKFAGEMSLKNNPDFDRHLRRKLTNSTKSFLALVLVLTILIMAAVSYMYCDFCIVYKNTYIVGIQSHMHMRSSYEAETRLKMLQGNII